MTEVVETSIPALLRERASLQPDDTAFTFVDYDRDRAGIPESLTWPQLYRRVRKMLPTISPATVYRNAQVLVRAGVVGTLERAGSAVKYDANPDDHHHFICTRCGSVADVYLSEVGYRLNDRRSRLSGAEIQRCEVQLHGLCARCAARAASRGRASAGGARPR